MTADLEAIAGAVLPEQIQDCRSEEGVTVGLVDAVIGVLRVLALRDLSTKNVQEALADLFEDPDLRTVQDARRAEGSQELKVP